MQGKLRSAVLRRENIFSSRFLNSTKFTLVNGTMRMSCPKKVGRIK
jgi:hypothetical protein